MTIVKRTVAVAILVGLAAGAGGEPEDRWQWPHLDSVVRWWDFYKFDEGARGEEHVVPQRVKVGGVVDETYEFTPMATYPTGEGPNAKLTVHSSASGNTYWVSAQAPYDVLGEGGTVGDASELRQFQYFRKTKRNATLRIVVTQAFLEMIDSNGGFPGLMECPWLKPPVDPTLCRPMSASVWFEVTAFSLYDQKTFFKTGGSADLKGWRNNWDHTAYTTWGASSPFWNSSKFEFDGDVSQDGGGGRAQLRLASALPIDIPLSSVGLGHGFYLQVHAKVFAHNRRQRESYVSARFRDPVSGDGVTFSYTGLRPIKTPVVWPSPPAPLPAPSCAGAPDPAAGTIQFESAEFSAPELPGIPAAVIVTRSGGSRGAVSATLATSDGTAVAGDDYESTAVQVLFADGESGSRLVPIPLVGDATEEPDETANLTLSEPMGCATLGPQATAVLTFLDNDHDVTPSTYALGGTVSGLAGTGLLLREATTGSEVSPQNGDFTFGYDFPGGTAYNVQVASQPTNPIQVCTVAHGAGTIGNADVSEVAVDCVTPPPGGILDPAFGVAGKVTTVLAGGGRALALQADGKIVVVGARTLARFNGDGTADTGFGAAGEVPIVFNGGLNDEALGLALQPDGKIVVVGFTRVGTKNHMAAARFSPDGSLDAGFGVGGKVTIDPYAGVPQSHNHRAQRVLIQPEGKIVVAGSASLNTNGDITNNFAVARLNTDGTLDTSFNGSGTRTIDVGGSADFAYAIARQSDGKLVLAGRAGDQFNVDVGLVRLLPDGQSDTSYGLSGNGTVLSDVAAGGWDEAADMVMLDDDRILVAVQALVGTNFTFTLVRYASGGGIEGSADIVNTPIGPLSDYGRAVAVQPDGKVVLAGQVSSDTVNDFGIVRYNADFTLDTNFGLGGVLRVDFFGSNDSATDVVVQPDGKIVVVGLARNGIGDGLGLLRVNP